MNIACSLLVRYGACEQRITALSLVRGTGTQIALSLVQ
jgi:hypothetical protein